MRKSLLALTLSCVFAIGCTNATSGDTHSVAADGQLTFTLPSIPDTLTSPQSRAEYLSLHYWDNVDFNDPRVAADTAMVEQAFVDYIDMLRIVEDDGQIDRSVGILVDRSDADKASANLIYWLAEKYLYETESPMLDEDCYLRFLNFYIDKAADNPVMKLRIDEKIDNIARNRVGSHMPNISLQYFDGKPVSLFELCDGKPAIVLIYDNDCDYCHDVVDTMMSDSRLLSVLDDDKVAVVAIDLGLRSNHLPLIDRPNLTWVWAPDNIDDVIAYRDTPSLYVIDPTHKILIKDASYDYVSKAIFH